MMALLKKLFTPPVFDGDEEKTRRASVINFGINIILFAAPLVLIGNLVGGKTPIGVSATNILSIVTVLILRRKLHQGKVLSVSIVLMTAGFAIATFAIIGLGTIRTPTTAMYLFLIVIAVILFDYKGIIISITACSLAILGLIMAENAGLLPKPELSVTVTQWVSYTVLFAMTAGISNEANQMMKNALQKLEKENIERKRIEIELRNLNGSLNALYNITFDLLHRHNVEEVLDAILLQASNLLESPFGLLSILEDDNLATKSTTEMANPLAGGNIPLKNAHLAMLAIRTRQPQVIQRYQEWSERMEIHNAFKLWAVVSVPIIIKNKVIGIIALGRVDPEKPYTNENLAVMNSFAQLAALALNNVQLLNSAQNELTEKMYTEVELRRVNDLLLIQLEENKNLQIELREQALHDPLTGLYNRRYLREAIELEVKKAQQDQSPLSVIVSDIDHFKSINDSYGHQVGDRFLVEIANLMKSHARSTDFVCRYGGEEFLIVMPKTPAIAAIKRAEEILQKCTDTIVAHEGKNLQVAMSIGVATYPDHGQEAEELIIKADKALYVSKQNGRNRITLSTE